MLTKYCSTIKTLFLCPPSDYKFLGILKRQFPKVAILGLTATATGSVLQDVTKILQVPDCVVLRSSFNRTNLYYEVTPPHPQTEASHTYTVKYFSFA